MYFPEAHAERDPEVLRDFIRDNTIGVLTTAIPHPTIDLLQSTHIVWVVEVTADGTTVLRSHLAKVNPQAKAIVDSLKAQGKGNAELDAEVLLLFTSPIQSYVTPRWYVETKATTGKVAPTIHYAAVQVYGRAKIYWNRDETQRDETDAWLRNLLENLTVQEEGGNAAAHGEEPWELSDAPEAYLRNLRKGIIGIEVTVRKLEGRFKLSQEESDGDWAGIVQGFQAESTQLGDSMADMMVSRGHNRPARPACTLATSQRI